MDAFCHVVTIFCKENYFITATCPNELREAIDQQEMIGVQIMVRRFLAIDWMDALELEGVIIR